MERIRQLNPMHINWFPIDLVLNILKHLPIQDAVKTSVLSRQWRFVWTMLPELVFDDSFCKGSKIKTKNKLLMPIYQVLLRHRGPLDEFELSLSNLKSCFDIDQFVLVVLGKGVKNFTICMPKGEHHKLPSSIFAYAQQIEYLKLNYCVFKPLPEFQGFSKLESLLLVDVGINGSSLSSLISSCPLLDFLLFKTSTNCGRLDIVAPNLEKFVFEGLCESICFSNTPNLESAEITTGENYLEKEYQIKAGNQVMFCGRLPVVEYLLLDNIYSKYMTPQSAPISLVNDLCHLKRVRFSNFSFGILDEIVSALSIIKNSKNLETLVIFIHETDDAQDLEFKEMLGFSDVTLDHLREVELLDVSGLKGELQFIKLILAKSPVLEKFVIEPDSGLVGDKGMRFFKEVSSFCRTSPLVEITYESLTFPAVD